MEANGFTHEPFDWDLDSDLAKEWTEAAPKRRRLLCRDWLPKTGFVVSQDGHPVIMYWLYFDPSCCLCFVDWLIARPRQSFTGVTIPAIIYAHHGPTRRAMARCGANTLVMRTQRAVARYRFEGWHLNSEPLVTMSYVYSEEELNG